jgi:transcriptional regulator with XRE-family HTH domain
MRKKEFAQAIGAKLEKIRKAMNLSPVNMAAALNIRRVTYSRNKNGRTIPHFFTLYNLGKQFGISMDWFILDEGPMQRSEKMTGDKMANAHSLLPTEIKELLDHMDKIPMLRYEILAQFHRFKEEHQLIVEKAMRTNPAT